MTLEPEEGGDLHVALLAVAAVAAIALPAFADLSRLERGLKDDGSVVTAADRAGERAVRDLLARRRPDDAVVGEEFPATPGAGGAVRRRWILDPIDGTAHFVDGDDRWSVLLALEVDGVLEVAVAAVPAQQRVWWAVRGGGASTGRMDATGAVSGARRVAVAPAPGTTTVPRLGVVPAEEYQLSSDRALALDVGAGTDAARWPVHPALLVAQGDLDVAVQTRAEVWDVAATTLIVAEAGGVSSGPDGSPAVTAGPRVFASGPAVQSVVLAGLAGTRP
ncbi:inositol monophosphatase family protein [Kineococcus sp. NPDC059986]|uniref:inositol monophosphatase family protein n=1 Tax=Kineococcus sp. NPDC059986 TaxID=3155538 RepID=UPI00344D9E5E